jgi:glycosyltransferase involved in cell wall biosynthesis
MASQRPVVGSAVGGIPDVIEDEESGLLVPPGDPVALAAACSRLLSDDDLCSRLAKNGRRAAETRFSWTDRLAEYMTVFREVTGQ